MTVGPDPRAIAELIEADVAAERGNGVLRRMLVRPPASGAIVTGRVYGLMLRG